MHRWTKRALTGIAVVTAGLWGTAWALSQPAAAARPPARQSLRSPSRTASRFAVSLGPDGPLDSAGFDLNGSADDAGPRGSGHHHHGHGQLVSVLRV